jgi:hypothetical protein
VSVLLNVHLADGARDPIRRAKEEVLVTLRDGHQTTLVREFFTNGPVPIHVPFHGSLRDKHVLLASLKDHRDAGVMFVEPERDGQTIDVHLMLVPRSAGYRFDPFATVTGSGRPALSALLMNSLPSDRPAARYEMLCQDKQPHVACLLNIVEALGHVKPDHDPAGLGSVAAYLERVDFERGDEVLRPDRVFAWARASMAAVLERSTRQFKRAPSTLHPGATASFKQVAFLESNVQISIHGESRGGMNGEPLVKVEIDIDYFRDSLAHLLLEVVPNHLTGGHTNPAAVYALRWIAGKNAKADFLPGYVLA